MPSGGPALGALVDPVQAGRVDELDVVVEPAQLGQGFEFVVTQPQSGEQLGSVLTDGPDDLVTRAGPLQIE